MKKIFLLLFCFPIAFASYSQDNLVTAMTSATGYAADTVTSTTAKYLYTGKMPSFRKVVSVYFKGIEISGTTAGTATLEVSADNVIWFPYYNSRDTTYSYTLADQSAAQGYRWNLYDWGDMYARIKVVGINTPNVEISGKYFIRN